MHKVILNEELHLGWAPMQNARGQEKEKTTRASSDLIFCAQLTLSPIWTAITSGHVTAIFDPADLLEIDIDGA
jgi:hypothetical protein